VAFWIYVVMRRGGSEARTYSGGPVRMGDPAGGFPYSLGPAVGGPNSQINVGVPTQLAQTAPASAPQRKSGAKKSAPAKKK
jgi:hypothetical protein